MPGAHTRRMTISHNRQALTQNRIIAAVLGTLGAASAIPIPLAQLNFAGLINVFNIDNGDSPHALLVIAGAAGILTFAVLALAFVGSFLAAVGAPSASRSPIAAALAGRRRVHCSPKGADPGPQAFLPANRALLGGTEGPVMPMVDPPPRGTLRASVELARARWSCPVGAVLVAALESPPRPSRATACEPRDPSAPP